MTEDGKKDCDQDEPDLPRQPRLEAFFDKLNIDDKAQDFYHGKSKGIQVPGAVQDDCPALPTRHAQAISWNCSVPGAVRDGLPDLLFTFLRLERIVASLAGHSAVCRPVKHALSNAAKKSLCLVFGRLSGEIW